MIRYISGHEDALKIYNTSRVPTTSLKPLIQFVSGRCESSVMAHLVVEDGRPVYRHMEGYSWQRKGDDPTAPSRVAIQFAPQDQYPRTATFHPAVGPLTFQSREEEFLAVLAHELRHVDQYWSGESYPEGFDFEADAERFALRLLTEYQNRVPTNSIHSRAKGARNARRHHRRTLVSHADRRASA